MTCVYQFPKLNFASHKKLAIHIHTPCHNVTLSVYNATFCVRDVMSTYPPLSLFRILMVCIVYALSVHQSLQTVSYYYYYYYYAAYNGYLLLVTSEHSHLLYLFLQSLVYNTTGNFGIFILYSYYISYSNYTVCYS